VKVLVEWFVQDYMLPKQCKHKNSRKDWNTLILTLIKQSTTQVHNSNKAVAYFKPQKFNTHILEIVLSNLKEIIIWTYKLKPALAAIQELQNLLKPDPPLAACFLSKSDNPNMPLSSC